MQMRIYYGIVDFKSHSKFTQIFPLNRRSKVDAATIDDFTVISISDEGRSNSCEMVELLSKKKYF